MSKNDFTMAQVAAAAAHIGEHSRRNESGTRLMSASDYLNMVEEHTGITPDTLRQVARANALVDSAATSVVTNDLLEAVKAKRAAGEDASGLRSEVRITTTGGIRGFQMQAARSFPNQLGQKRDPSAPASIQKFGYLTISIDEERGIHPEVRDFAREELKKALQG